MSFENKYSTIKQEGHHARSKHRDRYNLQELSIANPGLSPFVHVNKYDSETIDFGNPQAVKELNRALLYHHYGIEHWEIPEGYLCPPIPSRSDYIHYIADLLAKSNEERIPNDRKTKILDIGTGANIIYPLIGSSTYGWSFLGTEISTEALEAAQKNLKTNPKLQDHIELRVQEESRHILKGVIDLDEEMDAIMCNPPFHASAEAAFSAAIRKSKNLSKKKVSKPALNFGGQNNELWCSGGEKWFIDELIHESINYSHTCLWFSSLVSKETTLNGVYKALNQAQVEHYQTLQLGHGNKSSRIVAWTFQTKEERANWAKRRWT